MNKVFKVIWNHATQSWVAVSELTSAKGKTKSKKLTALSVAVGSALVGTPALAAVYVNNQEVVAAGSGSRIVISTGASKDIVEKLAQQKHDYYIRIGDASKPVVNDGQILIGYGINNQSSGEAGDTIIGHRARMGGGFLDSFSTGVGYRVQSAGPSVSIGVGARSDIDDSRAWNGTENGGVAIGGYALQAGNKNGGVAIGAVSGGDYNYITSVGALSGVGGFHVDQVKDRGYRIYGGNDGATSIGYRAGARGLNSVAVGREATTANFKGRDAVSVGYNTHSIGESSVALGPYAVAGGFSASEITQLQTEKTRLEGVLTTLNTDLQSAIDDLNQNTPATGATVSTVEMKFRVGQLHSAQVKAQQELNRINADLNRTSATPTQSTTTAMAIGYKANANNQNATAIGRQSQASAISAVALGTNARVNANLATSAVAIGQDANVLQNSTNAIALGTNASVVGDLNGSSNSIAIGNQTAAGNRNARWGANSARRLGFLAAQNATAVGSESIAGADNALTLGHKNTVNAPNSSAIGSNNTVGTYSNVAYVNNVASASYSGVNSHVLGSNINVTANNTVVIGNNVLVTEANRSGSVVLGDNSSVPTNTTAINSAKVGNITYSGFAGNLGGSSTDGSAEVATDQGRFVSIGNATAPRQIKHVAAGRIEADSTDAINGSQLYSLTGVVSNMGVSVANVIGGNAVLNPNGTVSGFSQPLNTTALGNDEDYTAPTTPAANVSTAITNLNNYVNAGWKIAEGNDTAAKARISPNEQVNFKADGLATVSVKENTTNNGADVTYSVQKGTFDTTTNGTVKANPTEGVVTNTDVATAVNNSGWNTTTTGGTNVTVNPGDQVNYVNGNGTTANVTTKT
ncbi:ESPR-type extended signal peptide-containing protein, partial [Haemophilus parahaemolyticus]|uniref:ESPR-type extended signal peptide-containing protein n=1 Tax=Haemophilus parahaemolyticus TaxID=735 RepID=UPI0028D12404